MTAKLLNRSLGMRMLSAIVALPIILTLLWLGGWPLCLGIVCFMLIATFELRNILRRIGYAPLTSLAVVASLALLGGVQMPAERHFFVALSVLMASATLLMLLCIRKKTRSIIGDWLATLALAVYVGVPSSALLTLRQHGFWWALTALLGTWAFDTGAFFVGRTIGNRKLAPHISPNKTWEGFLGGMVTTVAVVVLCATKLPGVTWHQASLLGVGIGIAATYGDLAESVLKRHAGVKDSGRIMPGHGGLLDRIDSLLFCIVVVWVFVQVFGA